MNIVSDRLLESERQELLKYERIISKGFIHMRDCAEALRIIRDKKLYREEFPTFQEYCKSKWNREKRTIYYLIEAAACRKDLGNTVSHEEPLQLAVQNASDGAVRALAKVPKRSQKRVLKEVLKKTRDKLTALAVQETARPRSNGPCSEFVPDTPESRS